MKEDPKSTETTSRRQFTKTIVTAAVAAPIVATVACKRGEEPKQTTNVAKTEKCPVKVVEKTGYVESIWDFPIHGEDHIPPMDIEGGGSLIIDSKNKLEKKSGSGSGPFRYEDVTAEEHDLYGEILGATIISEMKEAPFLHISNYTGFLPGAKLYLWYQFLKNSSGSNETDYEEPNYQPNNPDVIIKGGRGANKLSITIKMKEFDKSKSHKVNRPHRFKHLKGGGVPKHFRIGQWRFVNSADQEIVMGTGDDNYTIYLEFDHYQES